MIVKSPLKNMPDLVPEYPTRGARLTLNPLETVALWSLLHKQCEAFDDVETPTKQDELMFSVLSELEGRLSDKLTFRAKGRTQ